MLQANLQIGFSFIPLFIFKFLFTAPWLFCELWSIGILLGANFLSEIEGSS